MAGEVKCELHDRYRGGGVSKLMFVMLLKMREGERYCRKSKEVKNVLFGEKVDGKGYYILPFAEEHSNELLSMVTL